MILSESLNDLHTHNVKAQRDDPSSNLSVLYPSLEAHELAQDDQGVEGCQILVGPLNDLLMTDHAVQYFSYFLAAQGMVYHANHDLLARLELQVVNLDWVVRCADH